MMKKILILIMIANCDNSFCQEVPLEQIESQFENFNETVEVDVEDDELLQQLQHYLSHPMNLNLADEEDMHRLRVLTAAQIKNLIRYRFLLGKLISIYELQAIPAWDVELIRKLLPFITIEDNKIIDPQMLAERWKAGNDNILLRISKQFKFLVRYKHSFKNLLQFNMTMERDAGEKLFDFTSVHFFARDLGSIKRLVIGDFVMSMGQGLIMSQGMALKKSANVLGIKMQNEILRPYSSSGEYNFLRGIASTFKWKNWQTTLFLSIRKLDANIESDSVGDGPVVTSIITSGYHRTDNEREDWKKLKQLAVGGSISFRSSGINIGFNAITYRFSTPIKKHDKPYNAFSFSGDRLTNLSIHYDRSFMNAHIFGEFAVDDEGKAASINGLLVSLDQRLDCSFLYRRISPKYKSFYSASFTENTMPVNENGMYAGFSFRISPRWKLDSYVDVFHFPFMKYLVPQPSFGSDLHCQLTWTPSKRIEIYGRFKAEDRLETIKRQLRYQLTWNFSREVTVRERFETVIYRKKGGSEQSGFLSLTDVQYYPVMKFYRFKGRFSMFETDGNEAKVYAHESDVLYSASVHGYAGKGMHFQISLFGDLKQVIHTLKKRRISGEIWLSWMQTVYFQQPNLPPQSKSSPGATVSKFTSQLIFNL